MKEIVILIQSSRVMSEGCESRKRIKLDQEKTAIDSNLEVNEIAQLCYRTYSQLGKSGKPDPATEYSVLACIVQHNDCSSMRVVALATGTKCFSQNVATRHEDIVDCHAESLLKRAFKRYLIESIERWLACDKPIDQFYNQILKHQKYYLFVSQTPCGCVSRWKGVGEQSMHENLPELRIYKEVGVNRKPGRGDLCPKAGCIHKIAKWNLFGLQGRILLPLIGRAIAVQTLIIGNCEEGGDESRQQEIMARLSVDQSELDTAKGQLRQCEIFNFEPSSHISIKFASQFRHDEFVRRIDKKPTGSSIVAWYKEGANGQESGAQLQCEVIATGRKLGAPRRTSKKGLSPPATRPHDTVSDVSAALKGSQAINNKPTTTTDSKYHRPVDLEVSDSALNRRVDQLIDGLKQHWPDADTNNAEKGNDRRVVGVPDSANFDSTRLSAGYNRDEINNIYEHNWRVTRHHLSIFKGWPSIDTNE